MRKLNILILTMLCSIFAGINIVAAEVPVIHIIQHNEQGIKISIIPFRVTGGAPQHDVSDIVLRDLERSGKFRIMKAPSNASTTAEISGDSWRSVENVVIGSITSSGGNYTISAELFSSLRGASVRKISKSGSSSELRLRAHQIANEVFKELTGIDGVFDTKIAYIRSIKNSQGRRVSSLVIADADGYGPVEQVSSFSPLMSPTWSPDGRKIAYVEFKSNGYSVITLLDVGSKRRTPVSSSKGINGAPSFSPDGSRMSLTLSRDGDPEIYVYNMGSQELKRLTFNTAIDTEAVWSPDGRYLVFTSDRTGKPQLYRISASGGNAERITRTGAYNARASFSPDGKYLTSVNMNDGNFNIGVMEVGNISGTVRPVTRGRLDESPSFAPNGTMIVYATEYNRQGVLKFVTVDGKFESRFPLPDGDIREPAWGPKRKQ